MFQNVFNAKLIRLMRQLPMMPHNIHKGIKIIGGKDENIIPIAQALIVETINSPSTPILNMAPFAAILKDNAVKRKGVE